MGIVVIGAAQGLGLALVRKCLAEGRRVAAGIVERQTPPALEELEKAHSGRLLVFQADVTKEEEIAQGALQCSGFLGEITGVCNVAGVLLPGDRINPITHCVIEELRHTLEVNAIGAVIVAKHFYRVVAPGGMVLTVTSEGTGVRNCGTWVPCYSLSKTAATKAAGIFNQSVDTVDFYAVHPGRMNTEMGRTTAQIEPEESAEGIWKILSAQTAVSRENWYIDYNGVPMEE